MGDKWVSSSENKQHLWLLSQLYIRMSCTVGPIWLKLIKNMIDIDFVISVIYGIYINTYAFTFDINIHSRVRWRDDLVELRCDACFEEVPIIINILIIPLLKECASVYFKGIIKKRICKHIKIVLLNWLYLS